MYLLIVLLAVANVATAFYFGYLLRLQTESAQKERADLLNRIMARDYAEYASSVRDAPLTQIYPFLTDEEEARLERGEGL